MVRRRPFCLVVLLFSVAAQRGWGAGAAPTVFSNTEYVEDLASHDGTVWVATRGGVEAYDAVTLTRRRVYTSRDGLPTTAVRALAVENGTLLARTEDARCRLERDVFACTAAAALPAPQPSSTSRLAGARITATLLVGQRKLVGTAGRGVWLDGPRPRRLTPRQQLCGNHIEAVVEHAGELWIGTFDEGLCRWDGQHFLPVRAPFRMVNDLASTRDGLYVATTAGLFRTRDGKRFQRIELRDTRGVNDLAVDGDTLWAASTAVLWKVPLARGRAHGFWMPGGTHSLQAVDVAGGKVWLATEDRGLLRMERRGFTIFDRAAGLPSSWAVDVAALPDGSAYAATLRDGLVRLGADGKVTRVAGLPDGWLLHVRASDGRLWVGTQGGAASLVGGRADALGALPNPCVHALAPTIAGLWAGTEGGLALYADRGTP